jgi:hypothetical protein
MSRAAALPEQQIRLHCDECDCTSNGKLAHYDVSRCPKCGKRYWALRPKRNGPLVLCPYPGHWTEQPR